MSVATLADLKRVKGKSELVDGRIVEYPPMVVGQAVVAGRVQRSLYDHAEATGVGEVGTRSLGYVVPRLRSGRESFCAEATYYTGPLPTDPWGFMPGPPTLAVEVRGPGEDDPAAEQARADKRADYFEAGTLVVWDVDPWDGWIDCYRVNTPDTPQRFGPSDTADAEPAVPGWRLGVDWLMK